MGIKAHVLILAGAAIDHNPLLCLLPPNEWERRDLLRNFACPPYRRQVR